MNTVYRSGVRMMLLAVLLGSLFFWGTLIASAASDNATTSESYTPGTQKSGDPVLPARSNPDEALGAPDGAYVSLGYGGELIVGFAQNMSGNLNLTVQEVTTGTYPLEQADVFVSTSASGPWTFVGVADNDEGDDDGATSFTVSECYQYVRVVDTTDGSLHNNTSDGFDVDAFTADYDETCPETPMKKKKQYLSLSLHSEAVVLNNVETKANTGYNLADGSYGGYGGDGGNIANSGGEQDVEGATTGTGGTGGDAGLGGAVQTGDATASTSLANTVNSTVIRVDDCACDGELGKVRIRTRDFALLDNTVSTRAYTSDNQAVGSYAGDGGTGGHIHNGHHGGPRVVLGEGGGHGGDQEVDDSTTGDGGAGGTGSDGGSVLTGQSDARTAITNRVNDRIIRIR